MNLRFTKKLYGITAIVALLLTAFRGTAQFGNALYFNQPSRQYVTIPKSPGINLGATFTLEAVVNYMCILAQPLTWCMPKAEK